MGSVGVTASECKFCPPGRGAVVQGVCAVCGKRQGGYRFMGTKRKDPKKCAHRRVKWQEKLYVPGAGTYRRRGRCEDCRTAFDQEVPE